MYSCRQQPSQRSHATTTAIQLSRVNPRLPLTSHSQSSMPGRVLSSFLAVYVPDDLSDAGSVSLVPAHLANSQ